VAYWGEGDPVKAAAQSTSAVVACAWEVLEQAAKSAAAAASAALPDIIVLNPRRHLDGYAQ
jgi:hypothetical protein